MALIALVHHCEEAHISDVSLVAKGGLFKINRALLSAPYRVESQVPASVFWVFVSALEGAAVEITSANWGPLSLLSEEFGFDSLSADLSAFRPHPPVPAVLGVRTGMQVRGSRISRSGCSCGK
jgi:hypothetical protein